MEPDTLIANMQKYYRRNYTEPQRKVIRQYLRSIAGYALPHLEAELFLRYANLPMTSQIHSVWISIRENIHRPATDYQQVAENTEPYVSKEEAQAFLAELKKALDPDPSPDKKTEDIGLF